MPVLLSLALGLSATAQPAPAAASSTPAWDPAASYVTVGQDEPGYRSWYLADPRRAAQVKALNDYFALGGVTGVLPTWQLLRTATAWQDCGGQPFEVPPTSEWPNMIQTLRYIRDYVVPAVGPVEAVSVYRNPQLNQCAGGAPESAHKLDSAIDLVPLRPTTRVAMMRTLCTVHSRSGERYNVGLGFYAFLRFHVDSTKYRRWNMDPAVAAECPPIVHSGDATSVGQPFPQHPTAAAAPGQAGVPTTQPAPAVPPPPDGSIPQ